MIEIIKKMKCDKCGKEIDTGYEMSFNRVDKDETLLDPEEDMYVMLNESLYNTHLCDICMISVLDKAVKSIHDSTKEKKKRKASAPSV